MKEIMLEQIKKKLTVVIIVVALFATIVVGSYAVNITNRGNTFILPNFAIVQSWLLLEVSPPGYPEVGQYWRVNVYELDHNASKYPSYHRAQGAVVNVTVQSRYSYGTYKDIYQLIANDEGEVTFQYLSKYESVAFVAYFPDIEEQSNTFVVSTRYVDSSILDTLLGFNVFFSIVGLIAGDLAIKLRKPTTLAKLADIFLLLVFGTFLFVAFMCTYSRLFEGTVWGYPERIADSVITLSILKVVFYSGLILFIVSCVIKLILKSKETSISPQYSTP